VDDWPASKPTRCNRSIRVFADCCGSETRSGLLFVRIFVCIFFEHWTDGTVLWNSCPFCIRSHLGSISRWSKFDVHCAGAWSVQRKKRETIVLKGEVKVMMTIMSSRLLDLIPEQKANDHVGSCGVDCHWMSHVRASRQHKLIGDADNARMSAHGVDPFSLTDPTLLSFGSAARPLLLCCRNITQSFQTTTSTTT
jgi:hypothetical protein